MNTKGMYNISWSSQCKGLMNLGPPFACIYIYIYIYAYMLSTSHWKPAKSCGDNGVTTVCIPNLGITFLIFRVWGETEPTQ
jgi:hypothetical protein